MKDTIGYDPHENLKTGVTSLFNYHLNSAARLLMYIQIISTKFFHYQIFSFYYQTPESVTASFIINLLIIFIPASFIFTRYSIKKIKLEKSLRKRIEVAIIHYILMAGILYGEMIFFTIHYTDDSTYAFGIELSKDVQNQVNMASILAIVWLPFTEALSFHPRELRNWICGRNEYIDAYESQKIKK